MLEHAEIDVTVRWHRMRGDNTLWLPGTDHAGIATQMVVERKLAEEGLDRRTMGREKFIERVWEWKAQYGDQIKRQMIRLGASCDWSRERFTLDPGLSRAVREVFVRLYEKGLIYRGEYMVNWCPRCHTALSDLEVKNTETQGHLWHIRYPLTDTITTTSHQPPATRPRSGRHHPSRNHAGRHRRRCQRPRPALLPPARTHRRAAADESPAPRDLDDLADPQFGTGAVKVTPATDPTISKPASVTTCRASRSSTRTAA